jgi:hypothetical protein
MSAIIDLSSHQLRRIASLKEKIDSLQRKLSRLIGGAVSAPGRRRKFRMSASARARIAAAQRARWAKVRKAGKYRKAAGKRRRTFSVAAKAKIAAAARARWAKARAAGKNRL